MTGIELIAKERQEQIEKHSISVENDVSTNDYNQLKKAAIMLLGGYLNYEEENSTPFNWNDMSFIKMLNKSYKERLIIAGALIAAEIDRLNYEAYENH